MWEVLCEMLDPLRSDPWNKEASLALCVSWAVCWGKGARGDLESGSKI